ncbi:hypothetical protein BJ166DRAFT_491403 [Pestalotiopsis sp. NC0098]|nr:hypothetical protein BJ166DRAFT_491403 [Pestalotiopsis sp. NC0098]
MDPLSITVSTITLIDAVTKIYRFLSKIPQADVKFSELCVELKRLSDVLQSINAMRVEGQHNILTFVRVDQDLWKQSGLAFSDCEKTLQELNDFVDRIKTSTGSRTFLRRIRLATDLRLQTKDLVLIQERLRTSNSSFQTLLQVLNVSLSIRSNRSQQEVFKELKKLKTVIEASQHTMSDSRNSVLQSLSHQQLVHNQRELIRAAQSFYSTTSSAASTNESTGEGSQENRHRHHLNTHSAMGSVIESDFIPTLSSLRRRQIENYLVEVAPPYPETYGSIDEELTQGSDQYWSENAHVRSPLSVEDITHQHLAERGIDVTPGTNPSPGSDFDINHVLYTGLCQLAQRFIRSFEFSKAEDVLRQALRQCKNFAQGDPHQVRMRTQLVLVGFLHGKGRDMEASVLDLAKFQVGKAIAS